MYNEHPAPQHAFDKKRNLSSFRCTTCGLRLELCHHAQATPMAKRMPDHHTIQERARFLAVEIMGDAWADEDELTNAIVTEIRRFMA